MDMYARKFVWVGSIEEPKASERVLSEDVVATLVDIGEEKRPCWVISAQSGVDLVRSGAILVGLGRSWLDGAMDLGSIWVDLGRSWAIWGLIWIDLGSIWVDLDRSRSILKANMRTLSKHRNLRCQMALDRMQNQPKSVDESSFGRSSVDFGRSWWVEEVCRFERSGVDLGLLGSIWYRSGPQGAPHSVLGVKKGARQRQTQYSCSPGLPLKGDF
mgnify:CR=1 FL=1